MLERHNRLTSSVAFGTATRRGRRAGTRSVVLHLHLHLPGGGVPGGAPFEPAPESAGESAPRVGFVVGRAVGSAVHRNRVRRRLRHLARERVRRLPAEAVLVVRALPAAAGTTYAGLAQDFDAALARLDISPDVGADIDTGTVHER